MMRDDAAKRSVTKLSFDVNYSLRSVVTCASTLSYNGTQHHAVSTLQTLQRNTPLSHHQQYSLRWKHAGRMGHKLDTLDEMAHRPEREAAQERRKKKKDRKAAKKSKKQQPEEAAAVTPEEEEDDNDLWLEEEEEDDLEEGEDEEPSLPDTDEVKERMMTVVERFRESLKSIRGAEPTPEMFDDVQVNAYGSTTPLKAVGQVVIVSPTLAQITCFDPAVAKSVQSALYQQLELHATMAPDDPGTLQISLPRVSLESRQKTAHALQKRAEAVRQRVRQVRRKVLTPVKQGVAGKLEGVSKDDAFRLQQEIETMTDKVLQDLNKAAEEKHNSIMAIDQ